MRFNTVIRNFNLLNLTLLAIIFVFAGYILYPMLSVDTRITPLPAKKSTGEEKEHRASENKIPSPLEFNVIADNNIFHPERIIPVDKKAEAPLPKPDFVLYGTLITDDLSLAYMEDLKAPRSTPGRGKRITSLKKNDKMGGFTLKEIETDRVIMIRGEDKITVLINDQTHAKKRTETPPATASATPAEPKVKALEPAKTQQTQQQLPTEKANAAAKRRTTPASQPTERKETPAPIKNAFENLFKGFQRPGK